MFLARKILKPKYLWRLQRICPFTARFSHHAGLQKACILHKIVKKIRFHHTHPRVHLRSGDFWIVLWVKNTCRPNQFKPKISKWLTYRSFNCARGAPKTLIFAQALTRDSLFYNTLKCGCRPTFYCFFFENNPESELKSTILKETVNFWKVCFCE